MNDKWLNFILVAHVVLSFLMVVALATKV